MSSAATRPNRSARTRHAIRIRGTVKGVGFRPMVFRLATRFELAGFVRNDSEGVSIEIEGEAAAVARFPELLRSEAPPLARIESIEVSQLPPEGESRFLVIASSTKNRASANVPADLATCEACLRELFDPRDRRYRYPFINCTDCGPRYTIVRDLPYDRARTTMDGFVLCPRCREEYEDPANRRFHAEPNACPACGPHLELMQPGRPSQSRDNAVRGAVEEIAAGNIVAVKGIGGFFLAVNARNEAAVAHLRLCKRRPHRPFALMARDLEEVDRIAELDAAARQALLSRERPIVLLRTKPGAPVAPSVAPRLSEVGVMLPYTPLHHLATVAQAFLVHDRAIHNRADDSVVRISAGGMQPVRRARGFVPAPIALGFSAPPVLAVGGELKNTVCLTRGGEAFLSPHIGDLGNLETFQFFEEVVGKLSRLLSITPRVIAHDLHPDYGSTRWALSSGLLREPVQHHHAHIASCLAEHRRTGPVLGVAFDGTGCGPAGDLWGGEFLLADLMGFRRLGHLRPIALAGGEAAIREPWRLAMAALLDAGIAPVALERVGAARQTAVRKLIDKRVATPRATGAGRWFDAVAALCGVRDEISYEGQAAVELEAMAASGELGSYAFEIELPNARPYVIDLRPTVRGIAADISSSVSMGTIAARFHETLARTILAAAWRARSELGMEAIALSGGCFQNRILTERSVQLLEDEGFEVLVHRMVPPNDGGLALGQAAVAAFRLSNQGVS